MRRPANRSGRRGAVMAEAAIVGPIFLLLIFGMIDLGLGVFRFNTISQAARHGARQAMVHGELAPDGWNGGKWGATAIDVPATAVGIPVVDAVRPMLVGCTPADTRIQVEWPDGTNRLERNVRVTVTTTHRPMMLFIFGNVTLNLRASATMPIAH